MKSKFLGLNEETEVIATIDEALETENEKDEIETE